jgi:hypothetical protein
MMDGAPLAGWDNFYVIVGSTAGGLTGLTFVVIALIRDSGQGVRPTGVGAFVTPTIVHFCGVLALAAFMSMPHQSALTLCVGLALGGLAGVVYGCLIGANMWRIGSGATAYMPVREDCIWDRLTRAALYCVAVSALALLFIGIRNAWDLVVWMSLNPPHAKTPPHKPPPDKA